MTSDTQEEININTAKYFTLFLVAPLVGGLVTIIAAYEMESPWAIMLMLLAGLGVSLSPYFLRLAGTTWFSAWMAKPFKTSWSS